MTDTAPTAPGTRPVDDDPGPPDWPLGPDDSRGPVRRVVEGFLHPAQWVRNVCGGAAAFPLLVLFGLNLVDELDRAAYEVLLPNIRDDLGLSNTGILSVVALATAAALLLTVPIAQWADRGNRARIAVLGAVVWAVFSFATGLTFAVWWLIVARSAAAIGRGVVFPTHNSLLADYYEPRVRPRVYSFHRAANTIGAVLGVGLGAGLAQFGGWRTPFVVFAVPTLVLVVVAMRMRDPVRGGHERRAMGADADVVATEEVPPSFAEAYRMVWTIASLRRIFTALPFLAASIVGFVAIASIQYDETFGLDEVDRAWIQAPIQLVELVGVVVGARIATRLFLRGPAHIFRFLATNAVISSVLAGVFAWSPNLGVAVVAHALIGACLAIVGPGVLASLSLAIPARARSVGFSIGALFVLPGLIVIPLIGWVGDVHGLRWGMALLVPVFLAGGVIISTVGSVIDDDIKQVWTGATARAELMREREAGRQKLLLVRDLDVSYGNVQVLFDIDFEVDQGEIVALLGTNGAGKSTLLNAISGVVPAHRGAVIFDGRDITHAPPDEIAPLGIGQVPGGQGIFPGLTVAENLRVAAWMLRADKARVGERVSQIHDLFPILEQRRDHPAADLSGGQQQMLALSMAFLSRPRLLVIDELSIGLAPVVVDQLLGIVRAMRDEGTTIILVEQSVDVALSIAETAYFMEKGEIRFHGPTADLLQRPDVLRSVFLEGAVAGLAASAASAASADSAASPDGADRGPATRTGTTQPTDGSTPPATTESRAGAGGAPSPAPPVLEVADLSVRFGGITAVDNVTWALAPGEVLGVIGPNGAGKTTLFDLVSGFTVADTGRVRLGGHDLGRYSPPARARAGLGRSFQDSRLFPTLTVEETISVALDRWVAVRDPFNSALRTPAFVDSEAAVAGEVDRLIELMGIEAFRTKFVHELSTGSRRVVDLACVLAHRPTVVLLDEPSSGIAQRETEALAPLLLRVRDVLGASLVVIEHEMPLITAVSDRMIALDQGRLVAEGTPDAVLAHPEVVASYLGTRDAIARTATPPVRS